MSLTRNEKRIKKKYEEKMKNETVKSMNELQRFAWNGLQNGTVTNAQLEEMAETFCKKDHTEMTRNSAIKFLESLGYKITREEQ